jgi:uncharacterized membrane protein YozB (DUF420 family)
MGKLIRSITEIQEWANDVASLNTLIFSALFIFIIIGVLRMKKEDVEKYKNFPLDDNNK